MARKVEGSITREQLEGFIQLVREDPDEVFMRLQDINPETVVWSQTNEGEVIYWYDNWEPDLMGQHVVYMTNKPLAQLFIRLADEFLRAKAAA
ncbi:MAG: hypothetical protein ACM3WP_02095 [Acidobacteriota bacterium]